MPEKVPEPPRLPIIGSGHLIDPRNITMSVTELAARFDTICKFSFLYRDSYLVTSAALCEELCDEKRFCKRVEGPLAQLRNCVGNGLFTAHHEEAGWESAHNILVPALGPLGVRDMFPEMKDIATQMILKWARQGPEHRINTSDDFTRLTLDSLALCAMDIRFNSFYSEELHPFVTAMVDFLKESNARQTHLPFQNWKYLKSQRAYAANIATLKSTAQEIIDHRRTHPRDKNDLLNAMLFGKDAKTGQCLTDENVINNMITMLVAGHETTSGMLAFCWYFLLKNPDTLEKAKREVDDVVGDSQVQFDHISKVPYLDAVLRETLRLQPTAPGFMLTPLPGTKGPVVIAQGRYWIPPDAVLVCLLRRIGRDPQVFGEDAEEFKPERMYGENFKKLPRGAWKPFGNGIRGCVGKDFAWQEAILTLILMLQNFDFSLADANYELRIKDVLTLKPDGFFMKARLRRTETPIALEKFLHSSNARRHEAEVSLQHDIAPPNAHRGPMTILFGSNSGTCEFLSRVLASKADSRGFSTSLRPLDSGSDSFPYDQPVVIITASYDGQPPQNAKAFVRWLESPPLDLTGANVAVFGCGHRDWVSTYQRVPKLIEETLLRKGATALVRRGETDAARATILEDFEAWQRLLWAGLGDSSDQEDLNPQDVILDTQMHVHHLQGQLVEGTILENYALSIPESGVSSKRHVEIALPSGIEYTTGDYLTILPRNDPKLVWRVFQRLNLHWNATMMVQQGAHPAIPPNVKLSVFGVLGTCVELSGPVTRSALAKIKLYDEASGHSEQLGVPEVSELSLIEILEAHPSVNLPFAVFLSLLSPMRTRQYSISSSPLEHGPQRASITFSIPDPAKGHGVATNFLKYLSPNMKVQLAVKKAYGLRLPADQSTPIIMVAAGAGLAPFRAFCQERAILIKRSRQSLAPALLFVGCRHPEKDLLYAEDLAKWEALGAMTRNFAYSSAPELSDRCKYVQHRLWRERVEVARLLRAGAQMYVCGGLAVATAVVDMFAKIMAAESDETGMAISEEAALERLTGWRGERLVVDVFG